MSEPIFQIKIDEKEARGEVWMERGAYGIDVFVKGANLLDGKEEPVVTIDLFPAVSDGPRHHSVIAQLISHAPGGDAVVLTRCYANHGPIVDFELDVESRFVRNQHGNPARNIVFGRSEDIDALIKEGGSE